MSEEAPQQTYTLHFSGAAGTLFGIFVRNVFPILVTFGGTNWRNLKEFLFKKVCEAVCREGLSLFEGIRQNPQMILDIAPERN